jgi:large subunit ribosomal protein L21e
MTKRIGGFRRKTRNKLKRLEKGKILIRRFIQKFENGQKVLLNADSSVQKGMYFPRFHSKVGVIKGKKGNCYEVTIKDGKKNKTLIVHPVHLRKLK